MWLIKGAMKDGDHEAHAKYAQQLEELHLHEDQLKQEIGQHEVLTHPPTMLLPLPILAESRVWSYTHQPEESG